MTTHPEDKKLERARKNEQRRKRLGVASWATALAAVVGFFGAYQTFSHTSATGTNAATSSTGISAQNNSVAGIFSSASQLSPSVFGTSSSSGNAQGFGASGRASVGSGSSFGSDVQSGAS